MTTPPRDPWTAEAASSAARVVRERLAVDAPALAIILGSGLGDAVERLAEGRSLRYQEIPGFSATAVEGHAGRLHVGRLAGREVVVLAGRFHMYEGHPARASVFPVRVAHALGVRAVLATNAAGGLNPAFTPGDLVVVTDQINLSAQNPLIGAVEPGDLRFPDMSAAYSARLRAHLHAAAADAGVAVREGTYVGLLGPTYETPAEVRMLQRLGADVTGMSTVAEAIVAAALGIEFAAVSLVTNPAAGLSDAPIRHEDVTEAAARAARGFGDLLERFVGRL